MNELLFNLNSIMAAESDLPPALKTRLLKKGISLSDSNPTISSPPVTTDGTKCPNLVNPYHECTDYCRERWGSNATTMASTTVSNASTMASTTVSKESKVVHHIVMMYVYCPDIGHLSICYGPPL